LQLSIIIVNYNVKYFVEQCLYSVINAIKNLEAEIIVIDNNSTDGSKTFFTNKFTNVHFIWNNENIGFSKANNTALQKATGKYILFLNPDTLIPEDCFEKCLAFFQTQKDMGALGIRMIDGTGKFLKESKRGFPSLLTSLFKLGGLAKLFPTSGNLSENENHVVDVLSGAFMMVEKRVLDKTGGFDEDFFMYGEDIDLSYRIQKAWYKNYYFSESTIIHFKGESTKKDSLQYVRVFYGAMNLFVKKQYSGTRALLYSIFIQMAIWLKEMLIPGKRIFFLMKNKKEIAAKALPTLIVSDEKDYHSVIGLLKDAGAKLQVIGRVDQSNASSGDALGNLKDIAELINSYAIANIIFCINGLSVKEIIRLIESINLPVSYGFHTAGSCSIIGSSNKNVGGYCIAVN
jgi:GT2 family glycosyltransferase